MSEDQAVNPARPEAEADTGAPVIPPAPAKSNQPPAWMWIGLGGLLILALLVIFVLPAIVSEYELPLERRVAVTPSAPASNNNQTQAVSPFEEAQRAIQRKEAQDVLAELLERQAQLEALEVSGWAQGDYEAALEQASIGDEYYRTQDFRSATESYAAANQALADLQESVPDVLASTLDEGNAALQAGDSEAAEDRFSLALLLDPESDAAETGLQRARTLDQVLALFADAEALVEDGELEQARSVYQEIASLDSYNETVQQRIAEVNASIRNAEFGRVMSRGYALLEQGEPEQAIAAFEQAAGLGVNEAQARAAIEQTETEVANAQINNARERIAAAEAREDWQAAVEDYDVVLEIDPNLTFATQGRDYARKRAQLDRLLTNAINNPERFADENVFQETVDVYFTGRAIENPGPKLVAQLDELQTLLENSQVPRQVTLVSDNLTQVTILREAELGLFEQTTVQLKPGRYVALGQRAGYREVRKEFTVGFGETPEQVVVRCEERVVATSR